MVKEMEVASGIICPDQRALAAFTLTVAGTIAITTFA